MSVSTGPPQRAVLFRSPRVVYAYAVHVNTIPATTLHLALVCNWLTLVSHKVGYVRGS